jgi:hypothetical protein
MGEAPVSVLHRLWLLTRTLCILLHSKVSTAHPRKRKLRLKGTGFSPYIQSSTMGFSP